MATDGPTIAEGQTLAGPLFDEPMRVETIRRTGPDSWSAGLVGTRSEGFRRVTLTAEDIAGLAIAAAAQAQGATTLDRLHAAMLLQASGHAAALRALLKAELERGNAFLRLANALSALYPCGSQEKQLLDAMLLAVPK